VSNNDATTACAKDDKKRESMKSPIYMFTVTIIFMLIQGCTYFGHTREEWNNLTEREKAAVKYEYQTILDAQAGLEHSDKLNTRTQSIIDYGSGHNTRPILHDNGIYLRR